MTVNLAFIGFGGVGQALVKILMEKRGSLISEHDLDTRIVAVSDVMKGSVYDPNGLDPQVLLDTVETWNHVEKYPESPTTIKGWDSFKTIKESNADVIVEVAFTNVTTGQPAIDHCRTAFEYGKSVVTTNKGPVALAYKELAALAKDKQRFWGFEGTVMSGTPALRLPFTTLAGNEISEIKGILNGTTNFMLTEMEKGLEYEEALKLAQTKGYAEADPTSDVEGYDARYKTVILANVVLDYPLTSEDVVCSGMTSITREMLLEAIKQKKRWRLVSRLKSNNGTVDASVGLELLDENDPLATVSGALNAIVYECDLSGSILLTGAGAGLKETGFSLLIDLIHYQKERKLLNI
ncbi:homoserine dehydrogenase [Salipaludibacillus neizhouensis]|uniref:Homoserine dehydrogenase n=1 Tax=Salipaludibacillus neizhouensis TaxID=885475 RepID=A0A3A9K8V4_9BACI|nr:homoserine dehydrogenase [Salipaludibacillus neizhouensis]RKL66821.1 homoserine dehydrogenase [Salipaludibacillus neizhouensis]